MFQNSAPKTTPECFLFWACLIFGLLVFLRRVWNITKAGWVEGVLPLPVTAVFIFLILMQERTRSALLESLFEELQLRSRRMMGLPTAEDDKIENGSGGFLENFKVSRSGLIDLLPTLFSSSFCGPPRNICLADQLCLESDRNQVSPSSSLSLEHLHLCFAICLTEHSSFFLHSYSLTQGEIPYCLCETKLFNASG